MEVRNGVNLFTKYSVNSFVGDDTKYTVFNNLDKVHSDNKDYFFIKDNVKIKEKTVYDYLKSKLLKYDYSVSGVDKRIKDGLLIVGLSDFLNTKISDLSSGQINLLQVAAALVLNAKFLIFEDIFYTFDKKTKNSLIKLFVMMKKKYKKTIVIFSDDVNFLSSFTDNYLVIKNNSILLKHDKFLFYDNYDSLLENNVEVPNIVLFNKKVFDAKKIKLHRRFDVKDLMKDVYRNMG